jgi:exonuclease SbcD
MKPFSFVHLADSHLGFIQYNIEARRDDFTKAFKEAADRAIELKPNFMIIAGDLFHQPRPTNPTLAATIHELKRLRDNNIKVLAVDGTHDSAPNIVTGTILTPLDNAGLIFYLPAHEGACWRTENCYIYGIPSYQTKVKVEEMLPEFLSKNKPTPDKNLFNIFVFHEAVDDPKIIPPSMEAELNRDLIPDGFDYYAGGHIHKSSKIPFKSGILAYSGCLETTTYEESSVEKGFYYVQVNEKKEAKIQRIKLTSSRNFIAIKHDFSGLRPNEITEKAIELVKNSDTPNTILVLILEGILPTGANRIDVNLTGIRNAANKALYTHVINKIEETGISEQVQRIIFKAGRDIKTEAYEYFLRIFAERQDKKTAELYAKTAVELIDPLLSGRKEKAKELIEGLP